MVISLVPTKASTKILITTRLVQHLNTCSKWRYHIDVGILVSAAAVATSFPGPGNELVEITIQS